MTGSTSNNARSNAAPSAFTAVAHPNIALVKYWGKADAERNIPAVGSLSITLDSLATTTTVRTGVDGDRFTLDGSPDEAMAARCFAFADRFWPERPALAIDSHNNFPTAAGLASSASGFAALAVAIDAVLGGGRSRDALARCAGAGSGSAARSLYGGFVRLDAPAAPGNDIAVRQVAERDAFPLEVVIAVTSAKRKPIGSTEAMQLSARTSPYYPAWLAAQAADLDAAERAVTARDFDALVAVTERSCMKMHAVMLSSDPWLVYWNPATVACIHEIRGLRGGGLGVCFTIDAGPQVKAVCLPDDAPRVADALAAIDGVEQVLRVPLGPGAHDAAE